MQWHELYSLSPTRCESCCETMKFCIFPQHFMWEKLFSSCRTFKSKQYISDRDNHLKAAFCSFHSSCCWSKKSPKLESHTLNCLQKYKSKKEQPHSGALWKLLSSNCCAKINSHLHIIKFCHEYTARRIRRNSGRETCSSEIEFHSCFCSHLSCSYPPIPPLPSLS